MNALEEERIAGAYSSLNLSGLKLTCFSESTKGLHATLEYFDIIGNCVSDEQVLELIQNCEGLSAIRIDSANFRAVIKAADFIRYALNVYVVCVSLVDQELVCESAKALRNKCIKVAIDANGEILPEGLERTQDDFL